MKIVISHLRTKREIVGAFNICGSKGDLKSLAEQILGQVHDENWSYGWVAILPTDQAQLTIGGSPIPWEVDGANANAASPRWPPSDRINVYPTMADVPDANAVVHGTIIQIGEHGPSYVSTTTGRHGGRGWFAVAMHAYVDNARP